MTIKNCSFCNIEKNLTEFSGSNSQCKLCIAFKHREKKKGSPCISCKKPKEIDVKFGSKLCKQCAEICYKCKINIRNSKHRMCKQCISEFDKNRKDDPETKQRLKINKIKTKYKITEKEAIELVAKTNCQCCGKYLETLKSRHIDHCHKTGKVRDVLCLNCNAALGHVNDDYEKILKLINYLSKHQGGLQDLQKAKHFIDLLIDFETVKEDEFNVLDNVID